MGVLGEVEVVFARIELIADEFVLVGVVVVVGSHVARGDFQGEHFALARIEGIGLGIGRQIDGGLFDAAFGVGGGIVELDDVLSGNFAGVGDLDLDGEGTILGQRRVLLDALADDFPIEGRIAQAIAHREDDGGIIPAVPLCRLRVVDDVPSVDKAGVVLLAFRLATCLVIAVSGIDAFLVVDEALGTVGVLDEAVGIDGHVVPCRIVLEVPGPGIDRMAGRGNLAGQDLAKGVEAIASAREAKPQGTLDLVGIGIVADVVKEAGLELRAGVEEKDDVVEILGDILDQVRLVLVGLEGVVVGIPGACDLRRVETFAAESGGHAFGKVGSFHAAPGDDDEGDIVVFLIACLVDIGLELADGRLEDLVSGIDGIALDLGLDTAGKGIVVVELRQFRIDLESGILEDLLEGDGLAARSGTGTGTGIDEVGRIVSEDRDLGGLGKGKDVVLVLQKGDAFLDDLLIELVSGFEGLGLRVIVGEEPIGGGFFCHRLGSSQGQGGDQSEEKRYFQDVHV